MIRVVTNQAKRVPPNRILDVGEIVLRVNRECGRSVSNNVSNQAEPIASVITEDDCFPNWINNAVKTL